MSILTLPDEMLASVFKYSKFEDLTKMRKISARVDSVTRKYHLDKVDMDSLTVCVVAENMKVSLKQKYGASHSRRYSFKSILEILKYYLPKVRNLKELKLYNDSMVEKVSITTEVAELILGRSCRNLTSLDMGQFDLTMSFEDMRRILTKLNLKELSIFSPFTNFELNDELIAGLEFESLLLINIESDSKLSLPGLDSLCSRKVPLLLVCEIHNSTASELGRFFEKNLTESLASTVDWTLDVDKGSMAIEDLRPYFSQLKCFKNLSVGECFSENSVELTVFADNNPFDVTVRLSVHL